MLLKRCFLFVIYNDKTYCLFIRLITIILLCISSSMLISGKIKTNVFGIFLLTISILESFNLMIKWIKMLWNFESYDSKKSNIRVKKFKVKKYHEKKETKDNHKKQEDSYSNLKIGKRQDRSSVPIGLAETILKSQTQIRRKRNVRFKEDDNFDQNSHDRDENDVYGEVLIDVDENDSNQNIMEQNDVEEEGYISIEEIEEYE